MKISIAFRSGMSRLKDFCGATSVRVPIGVVAGELTTLMLLMTVPRYLDSGGRCFVDSGAFTAFRTGEEMDWPEIMRRYKCLSLTTHPENLYVVAPDKVGDQYATLQLLRAWRTGLRDLIDEGVNVIVPLQCGELPGQVMLSTAADILGTNKWIAGIPSNKAAMHVWECSTLLHHSFHILGRVQMDSEQEARIEALRVQNPDSSLSADANWLRSRIGPICTMAARICAERGLVQPYEDSSRTMAIAALIAADGWGSHPVAA